MNGIDRSLPPTMHRIPIDPRTAKTINCGKCGSKIFAQVYQIIKIPATDPNNPTGKELYTEDGMLRCLGCGRSKKLQGIEDKE